MRINDNGVYRDMTPEEVEEMKRMQMEMPVPGPSTEDRVTDLEKMFTEIRTGIEDIKKLLRGGK